MNLFSKFSRTKFLLNLASSGYLKVYLLGAFGSAANKAASE